MTTINEKWQLPETLCGLNSLDGCIGTLELNQLNTAIMCLYMSTATTDIFKVLFWSLLKVLCV